jgi:hypothetical protein
MPISCILLLPLDSLVRARRKHLVGSNFTYHGTGKGPV